jgi:hypothetical protein
MALDPQASAVDRRGLIRNLKRNEVLNGSLEHIERPRCSPEPPAALRNEQRFDARVDFVKPRTCARIVAQSHDLALAHGQEKRAVERSRSVFVQNDQQRIALTALR